MATNHPHHFKKNSQTSLFSGCNTSYLLLSLLSLTTVFLVFSLFKTSPSSSPHHAQFESSDEVCDHSDGKWIYDSARSAPYDATCKEIFKGWNCISGGKSNAIEIVKWRWQPHHCQLPQFNPILFLESFRDSNIVQESLGYKEGYRVDVDTPEGTWAEALGFHDILIFNTGHWWWAPSKFDPVKSPMLFFEKGQPVVPPLSPDAGLDMVLEHMKTLVEERARPGTVLIFRTQSPRHFEGGDWDQGGSCQRLQPLLPVQVEELFSVANNGTNVETRLVNEHLYKALKGSRFHLMDITHMSEFRADAHPATAGGKKHDDCMHWCLPGITDTWNDMLVAHLMTINIRT